MTFQGIDEPIDAIMQEGGSNLPSWYRDALINRKRQLGKLQQQAPSLTVTIPNRAPGWHEVGMEISCIPDAVYPWDAQVFKAIQRIAPDLVPVWVRWVFISPDGETVVFGRHALARVNKAKKREGVNWNVEMPTMPVNGCRFETPNDELTIIQAETSSIAPDLPGDYLPFGWNVYAMVRDNYKHHDIKDLKKRFIEDKKEALSREKKRLADEQEYKQRDLDKFINKKLENL